MDKKTEFYTLEREILDEEGLFATGERLNDTDCDKCMYCGYEIVPGEEKAFVISTGDTIHRNCWQDYAEDNFYELCQTLGND